MKATIIGAGIAGLTAALALRHHGVVSTLVEQAPAFGDVGAGIQISSNGMFVLKALGLAPQIEAMGVRASGVELLDANTARKVAYVDLDRYSGGLSHYMLHRADLIAALAVACHENGISCQFGLNVTPQSDIMEDSEALTHSPEPSHVLIGADGFNSVVRDKVAHSSLPEYTGYVAWRAIVPAVVPHFDGARIYMGANKHVVTYPLRQGRLINMVFVEKRASWAKSSWSSVGEKATLCSVFEEFGGDIPTLLTEIDRVHEWGLFRRPVPDLWYKKNTVLVGDAAHSTLPFMAQGANLAIEDAFVLARALGSASSPANAFAQYQALRQARVKKILTEAEKNVWKYHLSQPALRYGLHLGMSLLGQFLPAQLVRRLDWIYHYDVTQVPSDH